MPAKDGDDARQETFQRLKAICVPLMGTALLTPSSAPQVSKLMTGLLSILEDIDAPAQLSPPLISYIFLPLSTILRRNPPSAIPDQLLEKVFLIMALLCDNWWWTCEISIWEQIFMLCGAVIGGIESKGKGRDRDEEAKEAAILCLLALLRDRTPHEASLRSFPADQALTRKTEFMEFSKTEKFVPILGQTLSSILLLVQSSNLNTQRLSLKLAYLIIDSYGPDHLIPSVLPGVISSMTKVALGTSSKKGWANGEIVASALNVMKNIIVKAISDDACIKDGALSHAESLEALADLMVQQQHASPQHDLPSYASARTPAWLRGTSSQLHIAINTLTPLLSHPTPSAHLALVEFSSAILEATPLTLPQTQPLLVSYLLSLSNSDLPSVSDDAREHLLHLFSKQSTVQHSLLQTLMQITKDKLSNLPNLISTLSDSKVEHAANLITAVCRLASASGNPTAGVHLVSYGIGKLLGPMGGIERWGWSLLSALELVEPSVMITQMSASQLKLESDPDASGWPIFPVVKFRNVVSDSTTKALEKMFRSLGHAAGDSCLYSVEWFVGSGFSGKGSRSVTAIWCACRLLEGVAMISLAEDLGSVPLGRGPSKAVGKLARGLAKDVAELWDDTKFESRNENTIPQGERDDESLVPVQYIKGVQPIHETLNIILRQAPKSVKTRLQPLLHRALSLQLLAIIAGILQSRFPLSFINTLYPVLHSVISTDTYLSSTALATLRYITIVTSYASPANLLLSNFDYALDSISRRLTRRWLDIDATKVFVVLIRLAGSDVVERAGDVVEECFDRLDDFHGYPVVVEGLIEVLGEVVTVIRGEGDVTSDMGTPLEHPMRVTSGTESFLQWYHEQRQSVDQADNTDYGPAPRNTWGSMETEAGTTKQEGTLETIADEGNPSSIQALTRQIVARSVYFLTHGSPIVRARILGLLSASATVLPESALLPSIHSAWPFILNRLSDNEPFVIGAAASLIEALTLHTGEFMYRRVWDDIWPRFQQLLAQLDAGDSKSALARRGYGAVGTVSAYTHSHRLYRSIINTMAAAVKGVHPHDMSMWQVAVAFRRFLHRHAHEELQLCTRKLYMAIASRNADVVWLVLSATSTITPVMHFLREEKWKIEANLDKILSELGRE
ncbi:hypothetical protein AX17_000273 [Amanita inopinata Kibby_2008]|nr:hypothetical protein AX17_000273 [Amanita inopinata Kibby_2008]